MLTQKIIRRLMRLNLWHIVWIGVFVSIGITEMIVSIMSVHFWGHVTHDYLITGAVAAFIVSLLVLFVIIYFITQLRESEERLHSLFVSAIEFIHIIDRSGIILQTNPVAVRSSGYSEDELIGHRLSEFFTSSAQKIFAEQFQILFRKGEIRQEVEFVCKDRTILHLDCSASAVRDKHGEIKFFVVFQRDITERKRMEEKLRAMSLTDELTGLYNRRGFFTLVEQLLKLSKRQKIGMFMLYADVDNLKEINDTWGHQEGDLVLIEIADVLKKNYRESDIISRIGGDEFVVIPIGTTGDNIEIITTRLQKSLEVHNAKRNRTYKISLSAGIAYYDPENPCSIDELLAQGDKKMYEQKRYKQKSSLKLL